MKKLYLIRHAKSSWDSSASSDYDRPLNDRGRSEVPQMALFLKTEGIVPEKIVCSSAVRAQTTAQLIAGGLGVVAEQIDADKRLYLADVNQMQAIMREFSDDYDSVFLVAHNPTVTDCANALTGDNIANIPTCGVYGIELAIDSWSKLRNGVGECLFFQRPKEL